MLISVQQLSKSFRGNRVVDQLSFEVRPGRVTGFLGPNGSGKSTTMRMMVGLDRPDSGTSTFDGVPYQSLRRPLTKVGVLLDAQYAHPTRTAANHLWSIAVANGIARSRVDEVLAIVGLTEVAGRRVGKFSLGMQQRLALAAALLGDPEVLLLDEPVNGLDPQAIQWTREFMRSFAATGRSVFVSSHLLAELSLAADDLVVIGQGRLLAVGSVDDIVGQVAGTWVEVQSPEAARLAQLVQARGGSVTVTGDRFTVSGVGAVAVGQMAADAGVVLHQLVTRQGSLEDAFFRLTENSQQFRAAPGGGQ